MKVITIVEISWQCDCETINRTTYYHSNRSFSATYCRKCQAAFPFEAFEYLLADLTARAQKGEL